MVGVDTYCGPAAREAEARAAACRARRAELARRSQLGPGDAARAQDFLQRAAERALLAQHRLTQVRSRMQARQLTGWTARREPESFDAASLRTRVAALPLSELHLVYRSIGGRYDTLELDAFVHEALDWPPAERQVLAHAAWELTEFPS